MSPPGAVVIDGHLDDWGAFPLPLPSTPRPPNPGVTFDGPASTPLAVNPIDAPQHVALALSQATNRVLIAAQLGGVVYESVWVGIGAWGLDLPSVGIMDPGGGIGDLPCDKALRTAAGYVYPTDKPSTPAARAECEQKNRQYDALVKNYKRQFQKLFRISRAGVSVVSETGDLPVENAVVSFGQSPRGFTLEVSLPMLAMPRLNEAPLESLEVVARTEVAAIVPDIRPESWVWLKLPTAMSFEPFGKAREHVFEAQRKLEKESNLFGTSSWIHEPRVSYHPSDPSHIEVLSYSDCTSIQRRQRDIYEKQASLGDVDIGFILVPSWAPCSTSSKKSLAIYFKGKALDVVALDGDVRRILTRDNELWLLTEASSYWTQSWVVTAISADGSRRDIPVDNDELSRVRLDPEDTDITRFVSDDLSHFGWRGTRDHKGIEVTWDWDAINKKYTSQTRQIPRPPMVARPHRSTSVH